MVTVINFNRSHHFSTMTIVVTIMTRNRIMTPIDTMGAILNILVKIIIILQEEREEEEEEEVEVEKVEEDTIAEKAIFVSNLVVVVNVTMKTSTTCSIISNRVMLKMKRNSIRISQKTIKIKLSLTIQKVITQSIITRITRRQNCLIMLLLIRRNILKRLSM